MLRFAFVKSFRFTSLGRYIENRGSQSSFGQICAVILMRSRTSSMCSKHLIIATYVRASADIFWYQASDVAVIHLLQRIGEHNTQNNHHNGLQPIIAQTWWECCSNIKASWAECSSIWSTCSVSILVISMRPSAMTSRQAPSLGFNSCRSMLEAFLHLGMRESQQSFEKSLPYYAGKRILIAALFLIKTLKTEWQYRSSVKIFSDIALREEELLGWGEGLQW